MCDDKGCASAEMERRRGMRAGGGNFAHVREVAVKRLIRTWDSNPRVLANKGLALRESGSSPNPILRHTRLGYPCTPRLSRVSLLCVRLICVRNTIRLCGRKMVAAPPEFSTDLSIRLEKVPKAETPCVYKKEFHKVGRVERYAPYQRLGVMSSDRAHRDSGDRHGSATSGGRTARSSCRAQLQPLRSPE